MSISYNYAKKQIKEKPFYHQIKSFIAEETDNKLKICNTMIGIAGHRPTENLDVNLAKMDLILTTLLLAVHDADPMLASAVAVEVKRLVRWDDIHWTRVTLMECNQQIMQALLLD